jgi:hypothetical protein
MSLETAGPAPKDRPGSQAATVLLGFDSRGRTAKSHPARLWQVGRGNQQKEDFYVQA